MTHCKVLAWGSLIWNPGGLQMAGKWTADGPRLPLEFARVSLDGRLTLVIDSMHGMLCDTWCCDSPLTIRKAVENLAERERCSVAHIGRVARADTEERAGESWPGSTIVSGWCGTNGHGGAVWTALPANFTERTGQPFSVATAIEYLAGLRGSTRDRAFEYIRRAPRTTQTPVREAFERRWHG